MEAAAFLHALFDQHAGDSARINIWTLPDKRTQQFADPGAAAEYGLRRAQDSDVYVGCGLYAPLSGPGRGRAEDVVAITSFWADIDFGEGHKKQGIARDERQAREIIGEIGIFPNVLVHSGHGFQCWWLLDETITTEISSTLRRWGEVVHGAAARRGCVVDSVFDPPRVLRLPGTVNRKHDPAVPVRIIEGPRGRCALDQLKALFVEPNPQPRERIATKPVEVVPVKAASGDGKLDTRLQALLANEPKFRATWDGTRGFASESESDMSFASYAARTGLSDQEIAEGLAIVRKRHGADVSRLWRPSGQIDGVPVNYAQRTIIAARAGHQREHPVKAATAEDRSALLGRAAQILNLPVKDFIQYGEEESDFNLILDDGKDILIGAIDGVSGQSRFRDKVAEATRKYIDRCKPYEWDVVCRTLLAAARVEENPEGGRIGKMRSWLSTYFETNTPRDDETWRDAVDNCMPFVKDGMIHVHANELFEHATVHHREKLVKNDVWRGFKAMGFERHPVSVTIKGKLRSRSYWRAPEAVVMKELGATERKSDGNPEENVVVGSVGGA